MKKCKITVLKTMLNEELAKEYSQLVAHVFCSCCEYDNDDSCYGAPEGACFEARVKWLKTEHRTGVNVND